MGGSWLASVRGSGQAGVVLVRAEARLHDQLAVGEELIVRAVRVQIDACFHKKKLRNRQPSQCFELPSTLIVIRLVESPTTLIASHR